MSDSVIASTINRNLNGTEFKLCKVGVCPAGTSVTRKGRKTPILYGQTPQNVRIAIDTAFSQYAKSETRQKEARSIPPANAMAVSSFPGNDW